jgi:hypothetical protein
MASDTDAPRAVPPAWTCSAYRVGHDMHFIQARRSAGDGPGQTRPHGLARAVLAIFVVRSITSAQ